MSQQKDDEQPHAIYSVACPAYYFRRARAAASGVGSCSMSQLPKILHSREPEYRTVPLFRTPGQLGGFACILPPRQFAFSFCSSPHVRTSRSSTLPHCPPARLSALPVLGLPPFPSILNNKCRATLPILYNSVIPIDSSDTLLTLPHLQLRPRISTAFILHQHFT